MDSQGPRQIAEAASAICAPLFHLQRENLHRAMYDKLVHFSGQNGTLAFYLASVFQFRSLGCGLRVCRRAREVHSDTASAPRTSWCIALHNSSLRPGSASELPTQQNEKRQPLVGKKVKRVPSSFLGVEDGTRGGIDAQDRARRRTKVPFMSAAVVHRREVGERRKTSSQHSAQRAKHRPGHPGTFCASTTHEVSMGHRKLGGPQGSAPARDTGTTRDSTSRFGPKVVGLHSKPLLCRCWPLQTLSWSHD